MVSTELTSYFTKHYTSPTLVVKAPGRINIIGEHTDYNEGFVLPAAIEKAIYFAVAPNTNDLITIETFLTQPYKISFDVNLNHTPYDVFWGNYFKSILEILVEQDYPLSGFDCVFAGDIPIGSGLSSSAALCCGFIYALGEVLSLDIPRKDIALIAQKAEHKVGLNCGLMDQYAVLFGKKNNALFLDCKNLHYETVPVHLDGYTWVLINSNIKHNLAVDSEYNKRRKSCERVTEKAAHFYKNVHSLRDVAIDQLEKIEHLLSSTDYKRARYVIEENGRVQKMVAALKNDDALGVGELLLQGHWAMANDYEITTAELDLLVELGSNLPYVHGSRMMGGGFGGCTINLVKTEFLEDSISAMILGYQQKTGITPEVYQLHIDDGVGIFRE